MAEPYVRANPNDIITSDKWNSIQMEARKEIHGHRHTGGAEGVKISGEGIDPAANVAIASLKVGGKDFTAEIGRLDARLEAIKKTLSLEGPLQIAGGSWDVTNSEGDLRIGTSSHRLKFSVALGGADAGDARIRAQGGTERLLLGCGPSDTLAISERSVTIGSPTNAPGGLGARLSVFNDSKPPADPAPELPVLQPSPPTPMPTPTPSPPPPPPQVQPAPQPIPVERPAFKPPRRVWL